MTKEEILKMEAGRGLDKLVASNIMGATVRDSEAGWTSGDPPAKIGWIDYLSEVYPDITERDGDKYPFGWWRGLPAYSIDISAAWQVVEELAEQNLFCSLDYLREQHWRDGKGDWRCRVVCGVKIEFAVAKEAPEAICKAALLTKIKEE